MKKASNWIAPDWLDTEAWQEYESYRKELKNPWSDRARNLAANKLRGLSREAQKATINRTIESGWIALYPEKQAEVRAPQIHKTKPMSDEEWRKRQKVATERLREVRKSL